MTEVFFKCTLLTDVVLNSRLATEGNMSTLDYIPGSNFLGIVASQLYPNLGKYGLTLDDAYKIFHSGEVSFGDALILKDNEIYYQVPFGYMMVKGEETLGENVVYLQHLLNEENHPKDAQGLKLQLKQKRSGFISAKGKSMTVKKNFALKSAQDAAERRSKEGAMFGFESLEKGQQFIFSVRFEDENYKDIIERKLIGERRIGKSKTAQYGSIKIGSFPLDPERVKVFASDKNTLIYAQSNLCFFDDNGQPTFQPTAKQLGVHGHIDWDKSLIRSHIYSPWNGKRNTTETQRNCIAARSVFFVNQANEAGEYSVGEFQSEGLGRIIINPKFLEGNSAAECIFTLHPEKSQTNTTNSRQTPVVSPHTILGQTLQSKYVQKQAELALSGLIQQAFRWAISKDEKGKDRFKKVSPSQWGAIRSYASATDNIDILMSELFDEDSGYLTHGVAYERIWSKNNKRALNELTEVLATARTSSNPTVFIAKFASEMAKYVQRKNKKDLANAK